jgi:hypothetical protein
MQIRNSLKLKVLIPLTVLNLSQVPVLFEKPEWYIVLIFMLSVYLNQLFLFIVIGDMTGVRQNHSRFPTGLLAISKFLILIVAFCYAAYKLEDKLLILLEMYIFQLIILVLSTKRIVKKN